LNLGWGIFPGDAQPLALTVPGVYHIDRASAALLTLNYSTYDPATLSFRFNGSAWHDELWPFPACYVQNQAVLCGSKTLAIPVPLAEIVQGDNLLEFKTTTGTAIYNVDLILVGAGGVPDSDVIFADDFQ